MSERPMAEKCNECAIEIGTEVEPKEWFIEVSKFTETGIGYRNFILLVVALLNLCFCLTSVHMVMVGSHRSVDCAGGPGNYGSGCFHNVTGITISSTDEVATLNLLDPVDLDHGLILCTKPPCPVKHNAADDPTSTELPTFGDFPCTQSPCPISRDGLDNQTTTILPQYGPFPCGKLPCPNKRDREEIVDNESLVKDTIVKRDTSETELGHDPCLKPPCPQKRSANMILGGYDHVGKITLDFNPDDHPTTFVTFPFPAFPTTTAISNMRPSWVPHPTKRSDFMLS